jgi:hypothetical protein
MKRAAVTVEDSEMMARMQKRGQTVVVRLQMDAQILGYNVTRPPPWLSAFIGPALMKFHYTTTAAGRSRRAT